MEEEYTEDERTLYIHRWGYYRSKGYGLEECNEYARHAVDDFRVAGGVPGAPRQTLAQARAGERKRCIEAIGEMLAKIQSGEHPASRGLVEAQLILVELK